MTMSAIPQHPVFPQMPRRVALQAGGIGLLGLGMNHVSGLQAMADSTEVGSASKAHKSVIYIFLSV